MSDIRRERCCLVIEVQTIEGTWVPAYAQHRQFGDWYEAIDVARLVAADTRCNVRVRNLRHWNGDQGGTEYRVYDLQREAFELVP